ncbi:MAG: uroporphyrinogen-III synthase [Acidobacteriaceae bacterium]|nr:uroporphyrinogen-III synthase [Acidobacteriaceae bacterium]
MAVKEKPRVLVTRAPHQASVLAEELHALGAEPILIAAIALAEPLSWQPLDQAISSLHTFDWLLFTSANAVDAFAQRVKRYEALQGAQIQAPRIGAIGAATARALHQLGWTAELVPAKAVAESFAESLEPFAAPGVSFLLVRAEQGREHLPERLRAAGAAVTIVPAYRNVLPEDSVPAVQALFSSAPPRAITFTSSSSVLNLVRLLETAKVSVPDNVILASIGPVTTATLRESGMEPQVEAPEASTRSLASTLMKYLKQEESLSKS